MFGRNNAAMAEGMVSYWAMLRMELSGWRVKSESTTNAKAATWRVLADRHATPEARARAQAALTSLILRRSWDNFALEANKKGFDIAGKLFEAPIEMMKEDQRAAGKLKEAAVAADAKGKPRGKSQRNTQWIKD